MNLNQNYAHLENSYFFYTLSQRTRAWAEVHPGQKLLYMGVGDVTLPLAPAVIEALHRGVEDQAHRETFQGYQPECGADFLRRAIAAHYGTLGVPLTPEEVFISSGAGDDLGALTDLFGPDNRVLVTDPTYPAYRDISLMAGRQVCSLSSNMENGFLPLPDPARETDLIYLCSPNNPTGAAYDRKGLQAWVDYANRQGAVILFDAAYEAFAEDPNIPHSILEIPGAETCAIEICSLSKTAGFTGMRLGYTVVPKALERQGLNLNAMWVRNRTTKTNGVSCILQRGGAAVFTPEGQRQVKERIRYYQRNARVIMEALDRAGVRRWGGRNAPYVWMKCPAGMKSWDFFDRLLQDAQVIGTPGAGFGPCGEGYFRLSAFGHREETEEAARRIGEIAGQIITRQEG